MVLFKVVAAVTLMGRGRRLGQPSHPITIGCHMFGFERSLVYHFFNVHALSEEQSDDTKGSFCENLEHVFDHFPQYCMKIILRDFNAKLRGDDIFKPIIRNDSLQHGNNDKGVRLVKFAI